ncbi:MAG: SDR family NAD(P)-dependent oxidoreductase, partial [Bacteroidia bacterium]|nr:SDR family NAD(P)-dependent oxidoreductase [Bacteroidia bacterium]NNK60010.1 SDR family NAD(P)-dependent oxidoreductase [Flavobacteriaceae bacterium]NNL31655.1 SDR family NAD(P)-dependent oxidoreductase [Flavobacteriaceae bacterium]
MNLNLNNKNALVCGSTQGIGKATAMALAAEGVNVTLIARNEEKLKEVLSELPQQRQHDYIV